MPIKVGSLIIKEVDLNREKKILDTIQSNFGFEVFTPGLERTRAIYKNYIENIQSKKIKVITVSGTNGKGQTSYTLSHILVHNHYDCSVWSSPHILTIRERFIYNGHKIAYDTLENIIHDATLEVKNIALKVSFYEFLFLVYLKWVTTLKLDFLILEVGLGGRLDTVNHLNADLVLLTSISRDHQEILGNSYKKILWEKLGVLRPGKKLLSNLKLDHLKEICHDYCKENDVEWRDIESSTDYFNSNISLSKSAALYLVPDINLDLQFPLFSGRQEIVFWNGIKFILNGAHNPDGIREMLKYSKPIDFNFVLASFSKRDRKDIETMIKSLTRWVDCDEKLYLASFEHPKALDLKILEDVKKSNCHNKYVLINDWKKFLNGFKDQNATPSILVTGSYYFIGEVHTFLLSNQ